MTKNAAEQFCRVKKGELATIHSAEEDEAIKSILEYDGMNYWIGLSDEVEEGTFVWGDGSKLDYSGFNPGEPNDYGQGEDCVQIRTGAGWNDIPCVYTAPFVCQYSGFQNDDDTADDKESDEDETVEEKTYTVHTVPLTKLEAQKDCRSRNSDLVSIHNHDEMQAIYEILPNGNGFWIGLSDVV